MRTRLMQEIVAIVAAGVAVTAGCSLEPHEEPTGAVTEAVAEDGYCDGYQFVGMACSGISLQKCVRVPGCVLASPPLGPACMGRVSVGCSYFVNRAACESAALCSWHTSR